MLEAAGCLLRAAGAGIEAGGLGTGKHRLASATCCMNHVLLMHADHPNVGPTRKFLCIYDALGCCINYMPTYVLSWYAK